MNTMLTLDETRRAIERGAVLLIAGDESLLAKLPAGNWIAGTIPYFMTDQGGRVDRERAFVNELPGFVQATSITTYREDKLPQIAKGYQPGGCSFIILPATSRAHLTFAKECASYPGIFNQPLVGWVAGVHLNDLGRASPKVADGKSGKLFDDCAIVMHCRLADHTTTRVDILNLFKQGEGDTITFPESGFVVRDCIVAGQRRNFADYLAEAKVDTHLPLVADYAGAMINVSFQSVDTKKKEVALYAPVFENTQYRIASPVRDYAATFAQEMAKRAVSPVFSCNCILNYLYAGLEGKRTGNVTGPITFGEIAYMLLNQTMVYLSFE